MGFPAILNPINLLPRTGSARPAASNGVTPFRTTGQSASPSTASGSGIVTQPSQNFTPSNMFGRGKAKAWNPTPTRAGLNGFEAARLGRARSAPPPPQIPTWMRPSVMQPPPKVSPTRISPYRAGAAGQTSGLNPGRVGPTSLLGGAGAGGTVVAGASATAGSTVLIGAGIGVGAGEVGRRELVDAGYDGFAYPANTPSLLRNPLQTTRDGLRGTAQEWGELFGLNEGMNPNDLAGAPPPIPLSPSTGTPPFTGGQDPNALYDMWIYFPNRGGGEFPNLTRVIGYGPLSAPVVNLTEKSTDEYWVEITVSTGSWESTVLLGGSRRRSVFKTQPDVWNPAVRNVERQDGQPDTGGNPAAEPNQDPGTPDRQPLPTPGRRLGVSPAPRFSPAIQPAIRPALTPPIGEPAIQPATAPTPQPDSQPPSVNPAQPSPQIPGEPSQPTQQPTPGIPLYPGVPVIQPGSPQRQPSSQPSRRPGTSPAVQPPLPNTNSPNTVSPTTTRQPTVRRLTSPSTTPQPSTVTSNPTETGKIQKTQTSSSSNPIRTNPGGGGGSNKCKKDPCIASLGHKADAAELDLQELKRKLNDICERIEEEFGEEGQGELDLTPCQQETEEQGEPAESGEGEEEADSLITWGGVGNTAILRGMEVLTQGIQQLHELVKCPPEVDGALAVPEWWAVRPGANIPQLAVVLREIDGNGKVLKSQWSFTIPHYIGEAEKVPTIPPFTKGPHFGTLTLSDNTKIVINAASTEEAEGVINAIIPYIDPAFLGSQNIHLGLRKGPTLKVATVKPYTAQFYSKGQQDTLPDWTIKFP